MFPDVVQCPLGWQNHPWLRTTGLEEDGQDEPREEGWARSYEPLKGLKTRRHIFRDVLLHCQWVVNGLWWGWIALLRDLVLESIIESLYFRKPIWLVEILLLQEKQSIMRTISSRKGPGPFQCLQDDGKGPGSPLLFPRLKLYRRLWHLYPVWEDQKKTMCLRGFHLVSQAKEKDTLCWVALQPLLTWLKYSPLGSLWEVCFGNTGR